MTFGWARMAWVCCFGLAGLACSQQESPARGRPDVFILLIDCLRADHVGSYGYSRNTTPNLDRFSSEAVRFSQAISQSSFTKTSIASLFTSRYPHSHGVFSGSRKDKKGNILSDVLKEEEVTLAETLASEGYVTGGFLQQAHLRTYMGFAQGFSEYDAEAGGIEKIHAKAYRWIRRVMNAKSFFVYLHYIDLHDPYRPKAPYDKLYGDGSNPYANFDLENWGSELGKVRRGQREVEESKLKQMVAYYDGLINKIDTEIGTFFESLKESYLYDSSLIIVTSDHGDGFMEHGFLSHSTVPYEELVQVPLLIRFPGGEHGGRVVETPVALIDLMPTILDVAGIGTESESQMQGLSLLNVLSPKNGGNERGLPARVIFSEVAYSVGASSPWIGVRRGNLKYLYRNGEQDRMFDLANDPGETINIVTTRPWEAARFRKLALAAVEQWQGRNDETGVPIDEEALKELRALGYIN